MTADNVSFELSNWSCTYPLHTSLPKSLIWCNGAFHCEDQVFRMELKSTNWAR